LGPGVTLAFGLAHAPAFSLKSEPVGQQATFFGVPLGLNVIAHRSAGQAAFSQSFLASFFCCCLFGTAWTIGSSEKNGEKIIKKQQPKTRKFFLKQHIWNPVKPIPGSPE
jgi:hypothetical protein